MWSFHTSNFPNTCCEWSLQEFAQGKKKRQKVKALWPEFVSEKASGKLITWWSWVILTDMPSTSSTSHNTTKLCSFNGGSQAVNLRDGRPALRQGKHMGRKGWNWKKIWVGCTFLYSVSLLADFQEQFCNQPYPKYLFPFYAVFSFLCFRWWWWSSFSLLLVQKMYALFLSNNNSKK